MMGWMLTLMFNLKVAARFMMAVVGSKRENVNSEMMAPFKGSYTSSKDQSPASDLDNDSRKSKQSMKLDEGNIPNH
jgi:flagellar motor protein MotB